MWGQWVKQEALVSSWVPLVSRTSPSLLPLVPVPCAWELDGGCTSTAAAHSTANFWFVCCKSLIIARWGRESVHRFLSGSFQQLELDFFLCEVQESSADHREA